MMVVMVVPIMPVRFEGAIAVPIGPIGMAAIRRVTVAAITIAIAIVGPVMAAAGKAAAQGQQ
jgi:hypothetical protein